MRVLVTGAARGLGREFVDALEGARHDVFAADLDEDGLAGLLVPGVRCDVSADTSQRTPGTDNPASPSSSRSAANTSCLAPSSASTNSRPSPRAAPVTSTRIYPAAAVRSAPASLSCRSAAICWKQLYDDPRPMPEPECMLAEQL